jgi:hypothetical protein
MTIIRIAMDNVEIVIGTEMKSMSNMREGLTKIVHYEEHNSQLDEYF